MGSSTRIEALRPVHKLETTAETRPMRAAAGPAVDAPDPVGEHVVDEGGPGEDEDHGGEGARALGRGTEKDGGDEVGKHHLVGGKDNLGELAVGLGDGALEDAAEADVAPIAEEGTAGFGEDEGVADEEPLEGDDRQREHRKHQELKRILASGQARIQVTQARDHENDEHRATQDPGNVSWVVHGRLSVESRDNVRAKLIVGEGPIWVGREDAVGEVDHGERVWCGVGVGSGNGGEGRKRVWSVDRRSERSRRVER
jgi:hypothetical protein